MKEINGDNSRDVVVKWTNDEPRICSMQTVDLPLEVGEEFVRDGIVFRVEEVEVVRTAVYRKVFATEVKKGGDE